MSPGAGAASGGRPGDIRQRRPFQIIPDKRKERQGLPRGRQLLTGPAKRENAQLLWACPQTPGPVAQCRLQESGPPREEANTRVGCKDATGAATVGGRWGRQGNLGMRGVEPASNRVAPVQTGMGPGQPSIAVQAARPRLLCEDDPAAAIAVAAGRCHSIATITLSCELGARPDPARPGRDWLLHMITACLRASRAACLAGFRGSCGFRVFSNARYGHETVTAQWFARAIPFPSNFPYKAPFCPFLLVL